MAGTLNNSASPLIVVLIIGVVEAVDLNFSAPAAGMDELVIPHVDANVTDSMAEPTR